MTYSKRTLAKVLKAFNNHPEGISFWTVVVETKLSFGKVGEVFRDLELEFREPDLWVLIDDNDNE